MTRLPRAPWQSGYSEVHFKRWMNQQLDDFHRRRDEEMALALQPETPEEMKYWDYQDEVAAKIASRQLKRGRVIQAVKQNDSKALKRLTANNPEMMNLALAEFTRKRSRGRAKGDPRPRDLDPLIRDGLEEAAVEMDHIKKICIQHFRWKGVREVAVEIAADRFKVDPEQLRHFLSNRKRDSAS